MPDLSSPHGQLTGFRAVRVHHDGNVGLPPAVRLPHLVPRLPLRGHGVMEDPVGRLPSNGVLSFRCHRACEGGEADRGWVCHP